MAGSEEVLIIRPTIYFLMPGIKKRIHVIDHKVYTHAKLKLAEKPEF